MSDRFTFVTQDEKDYLSVYPQPEIIASSLVQILETQRAQREKKEK